METSELYSRVSEQLLKCGSDFLAFSNSPGWEQTDVISGTIGMEKYNNERKQYIKGMGIVNGSCESILNLIMNLECRKKWVPHLHECRLVTEFDKNFIIIHELYSLPWPISNRDFVIGLKAFEKPDGILVAIQDVNNVIDEVPGVVRASIICAGFYLKRLDAENTQVTVMHCTDPKGAIPKLFVTQTNKQSFTSINVFRELLKAGN